MKKFETPVIEVVKFAVADVIATSTTDGPNTGEGGTDIVNPFG